MKEHLVSVVIPTYNRKEKLIRAIKSVNDQSYKNIEIIIIDDTSDFNVESFLNNNLVTTENNIKVFRNTSNLGPSLSRNMGVKKSTGEFIAFLDSDDFFLPDKIAKQIKAINDQNADFCYCGWRWIDEKTNNILQNRKVSSNGLINGKSRYYFNIIQDLLVHKKCFDTIEFLDVRTFENYDFNLKLFSKYKPAYVEDVLVNCYHHFSDRASDIYVGNQNILIDLLDDHQSFLKKDKKFIAEIRLKIAILLYKDGKINKSMIYFSKNIFTSQSLRSIYHLVKLSVLPSQNTE